MTNNRFVAKVEALKGQFVYAASERSHKYAGLLRLHTTAEEVAVFERTIGHSLPEDYRNFLCHFGGFAFFHGARFLLKQSRGEATIEIFFGLMPGDPNDILRNWHMSHFGSDGHGNHFVPHDFIPSEFLPVGQDAGSNPICLSIAGTNKGAIYLWVSQEAHDPPTYTSAYLVADSFTEFFMSLKRDDES